VWTRGTNGFGHFWPTASREKIPAAEISPAVDTCLFPHDKNPCFFSRPFFSPLLSLLGAGRGRNQRRHPNRQTAASPPLPSSPHLPSPPPPPSRGMCSRPFRRSPTRSISHFPPLQPPTQPRLWGRSAGSVRARCG
jgi:hypothetical protein